MNTKKDPSFLTLVASDAWYWEEQRAPDTVQGFALDLYHLHPQDVDGMTHREENATYHIFQDGEYRTLPANAPRIDFDL